MNIFCSLVSEKGLENQIPGVKEEKGHSYEIYMINGKGYRIRYQLKRRGKGLCFSRNLGSLKGIILVKKRVLFYNQVTPMTSYKL